MLNRKFNDITWWSDDYETLAYYYEVCAVEITVKLNPDSEKHYIRETRDLDIPISEYTYGVAEVLYPKGTTWYSFCASYLNSNITDIKEIFPDLSKYYIRSSRKPRHLWRG